MRDQFLTRKLAWKVPAAKEIKVVNFFGWLGIYWPLALFLLPVLCSIESIPMLWNMGRRYNTRLSWSIAFLLFCASIGCSILCMIGLINFLDAAIKGETI